MEIERALSEKFPGLGVLELVISDIRVTKSSFELETFKKSKQDEIRKEVKSLEVIRDLPIIRAYRDFYWKVGIDPTKTRPAGEALLRRIIGGKDLPAINTLVDSYNIASAQTMISVAAFDLEKISREDLFMRTASRGELFLGIGMQSPISLDGIEVVVEDRKNEKLVAVYPYRDADESKVSYETSKVLFMMCGVPWISREDLAAAQEIVARYVSKFCR